MATYIIGDVQGCYEELLQLLDKINFNPRRDKLWFTGDLVNRGPGSYEVLRLVKSLKDRALTVLGNHDIHLLAVALSIRNIKATDSFDEILSAPDRDELLEWLRWRPLLHYDQTQNIMLIHAGLPPQWDVKTAISCAIEAENIIRSKHYSEALNNFYGNHPTRWSNSLTSWERLRFILNCLVRLRYVDPDGNLALEETGPPNVLTFPYIPWFKAPNRKSKLVKIYFGHWASLGFYSEDGICALDTGCVWGSALTAICLDNDEVFRVPCKGSLAPGED
jgi:bis(5'-nucleosyl)-tetraphosphatase (symmetrical)